MEERKRSNVSVSHFTPLSNALYPEGYKWGRSFAKEQRRSPVCLLPQLHYASSFMRQLWARWGGNKLLLFSNNFFPPPPSFLICPSYGASACWKQHGKYEAASVSIILLWCFCIQYYGKNGVGTAMNQFKKIKKSFRGYFYREQRGTNWKLLAARNKPTLWNLSGRSEINGENIYCQWWALVQANGSNGKLVKTVIEWSWSGRI